MLIIDDDCISVFFEDKDNFEINFWKFDIEKQLKGDFETFTKYFKIIDIITDMTDVFSYSQFVPTINQVVEKKI